MCLHTIITTVIYLIKYGTCDHFLPHSRGLNFKIIKLLLQRFFTYFGTFKNKRRSCDSSCTGLRELNKNEANVSAVCERQSLTLFASKQSDRFYTTEPLKLKATKINRRYDLSGLTAAAGLSVRYTVRWRCFLCK